MNFEYKKMPKNCFYNHDRMIGYRYPIRICWWYEILRTECTAPVYTDRESTLHSLQKAAA